MAGSGAKTELITIERFSTVPDGGGGAAKTWGPAGQMWAEAEWISGDEQSRQGALRARAKYRFTVLSAAADEIAVTTADRILWNGETYNIRERPRRLARKPETEIIAETGVTQ